MNIGSKFRIRKERIKVSRLVNFDIMSTQRFTVTTNQANGYLRFFSLCEVVAYDIASSSENQGKVDENGISLFGAKKFSRVMYLTFFNVINNLHRTVQIFHCKQNIYNQKIDLLLHLKSGFTG